MLLTWFACVPDAGRLTLHAPLEPFADFAAFTGDPGLVVDPSDVRGRGQHVVVVEDASLGAGAYRIERESDDVIVVTGGDLLGEQFGVAATLEAAGFRFVHPTYTVFPTTFDALRDAVFDGEVVTPDTPRNALQVHTLHPIEATFDLWVPSEDGLDRAHRIVDWLVKNRGNHLQWPALDEILRLPHTAEDWSAHTRAIVDYAHQRGVTIGLGVQLFGSSNLQLAFDLVDGDYDESEVDARLALIASATPDAIDLSFGEFSGADPAVFVDTANKAVGRMRAAMPGVDVSTVIHVGNAEDLRVDYNGETDLLYYFLAKYIDGTRPLVHTVMYYNLFEDAGGAYLHDEFDEHRAFLFDRIRAGQPVGYFPESAYWIAFDDSVPLYLPVYLRSRHLDLQRIRDEAGPLPSHALFGSGWEWGYWMNDALTLRMASHLPASWGDEVHDWVSAWGDDGRAMADVVVALGDLQHDALIVDRLAPYLAGRDAIIDLGDTLGIVSQPDRPRLGEVAAFDADALVPIDAVVAGLDALSANIELLRDDATDLGGRHPVFDEVRDGLAIDALRAGFAADVYGAAVAVARGQDAEAHLADADAALAAARAVVARRRAATWWTGGDEIWSQEVPNPTIYQFGYLAKADSLCYWVRELTEAQNLARGTTESLPPCT
ncbi:MAG: hypothetical protein ABMB14_07860 [Myxococcota bacterium]